MKILPPSIMTKQLGTTVQSLLLSVFAFFLMVSSAEPQMDSKDEIHPSIGVVAPDKRVALSAKIMGRIVKLTHDEGDRVKEGELLIELDNAELMAELESARAALGLARAESFHKHKQALRRKKLFDENSISEDAAESAILAAAVAAENEKIAEARVTKVKTALKETLILAPFDAVVISISCDVGLVTNPGSPLFVVEDHSKLKFQTKVRERDIARILMGQKVEVSIDALGDKRFYGKVSKIIPSGDIITHMFKVEVDLPPIERLYVGMFGKAFF